MVILSTDNNSKILTNKNTAKQIKTHSDGHTLTIPNVFSFLRPKNGLKNESTCDGQ